MEIVRGLVWIVGLLKADSTLMALATGGVHNSEAPRKTACPYVIVNHQAARDSMGLGTVRVVSHLTYLVKAVGEGQNYIALEPLADRIDALLHGASGEVAGLDGAGAELLSCVRVAPVAYPETQEGQPFRHLGGLYQIVATNRGPAPEPEP